MTNEERRQALNEARSKAVEWAEKAEDETTLEYVTDTLKGQEAVAMANMWANVAQALKTGDATSDTPDH